MNRLLTHILELLGIGGLVWLLAFIPWTKMALGGALALLGAFFPTITEHSRTSVEQGHITWSKLLIKFRGTVRFAVVVAGIVLIVGAVLDGYEGRERNSPGHVAANAVARFLSQKALVVAALEAEAGKRGTPVSLTDAEISAIVSKEAVSQDCAK